MNIQKRNKYILFAVFLYGTTIIDILKCMMTLFGISSNYLELTRDGLYVIIFILFYIYANKNVRNLSVIISLAFFLLLCLTCLINPEIVESAKSIILLFFSRFLIACVLFIGIDDIVYFAQICHSFSWLCIVYFIVYSLLPHGVEYGFEYNMAFSNNMILPAVMSVFYLIIKCEKTLYSIIVLAISGIGIIMYGSRGAIVAVVLSFLFSIVVISLVKKEGILDFILLGIIISSILVFRNSIVLTLLRFFPNSRTLHMIHYGTNNLLSNRNVFWDIAFSNISNSPFAFRGIAGDCLCICKDMNIDFSLSYYSHNFFLELLLSFGVVIGGILSLLFCYRCILVIKKSIIDKERSFLIIAFFFPNIVLMMFSGSLWQSYQYWIVIGILLRDTIKLRKNNYANWDSIKGSLYH